MFVFTGGIKGWPRERLLYPEVRRLGGKVGARESALAKADWLVHGDSLSKGESTVKIKGAHARGVPIISEEDFMWARDKERRIRRARR